jgi:hypothetical protein
MASKYRQCSGNDGGQLSGKCNFVVKFARNGKVEGLPSPGRYFHAGIQLHYSCALGGRRVFSLF